jgi:hypothetical protein
MQNEEHPTYNWLKKHSWLFMAIVSFVGIVGGAFWFVRDRDFEPALTTLGSLTVFISSIFSEGTKGLIFLLGFALGVALTVSLIFFFPQSKTEIKSEEKSNNSHSETSPTERTNQSNSTQESAIVVEPTWVYEHRPLAVLDSQVMIKVSGVIDFIRCATFDVDIPEQKPINWGATCVGTRKTFTYKGVDYYFNVLEVSGSGAKINIAKKL